ncbi:MAG: hypothetical protein Q4G12_08905 [Bacteroidales bacterium]|nr:hypothetical protein [Bacteroidales bacterium]
MNISELPIDARALLYFHIRSTEHYLTGKINEDQSIPYVKFRERTLSQLAIGGADVMQMQVINRFGGMCRLFDASYCLTAIQKSIKGNSQRAVVRNLLWQFMDELEFDMHINSDTAYNYKWNLVNQIIKDKLFG